MENLPDGVESHMSEDSSDKAAPLECGEALPQGGELPDLKEHDLEDLKAFLAPLGKQSFRAVQVLKWLYQKDVSSFEQMTNLAKSFRTELAAKARISRYEPLEVHASADGTQKLVFLMDDGSKIESVLIPEEDRLTLCISSQVGCPLACRFCVTGMGGYRRNLRVSEIVGQIQGAARRLGEGERITNLVVMGMGEPLLNFDNLVKALRICLYDDGLGFSHRRITVSTAGVVPNIPRLGAALPVNLAVSLNATTEELRRELMPITRKYSLASLLEACRRFPLPDRKRITFEYVLLDGVNDSLEEAARLVKLLHGIPAAVNLIAYNPNEFSGYRAPSPERVKAFQQVLLDRHLFCAVRKSGGKDIGAACGQLGMASILRGSNRG